MESPFLLTCAASYTTHRGRDIPYLDTRPLPLRLLAITGCFLELMFLRQLQLAIPFRPGPPLKE